MILAELYWAFFRIGALTFGGGYAMIALFQEEMVGRGWLTATQFANIVSVAQMTPGPIAMNTATFTGKMLAGFPGAAAATLGLASPAVLLSALALGALDRIASSARLRGIIRGIRAAAIGLIGTAVLFFLENSVVDTAAGEGTFIVRWPALALFGVILVLVGRFRWKPVASILLALGLSLAWGLLMPLIAGG